jgi:hypothetical protein
MFAALEKALPRGLIYRVNLEALERSNVPETMADSFDASEAISPSYLIEHEEQKQ